MARSHVGVVGLVMSLALAACSSDGESKSGGGGSGGAGGAGTGGAAGAAGQTGGTCAPTPARCDALGKGERPFRVSEHAAAYANDELLLVLFGGSSAVPDQCNIPGPEYNAETWVYDDPCGKWTAVPASGPSARGRHMMAAGGGSVYLFGGRFRPTGQTGSYTLYDDLWRFDPKARTWSEITVSGAKPSARVSGALVWDDKRKRLWLYAGNTSASGASYAPVGDLWSFDPATSVWTEAPAGGSTPPARLMHGMTVDTQRDRLVVFGGADETAFAGTATYMKDTWVYDLEAGAWSLLDDGSSTAPEGRFWPTVVYDDRTDAVLLFGGHDDGQLGNRNDLWRLSPSGEWLESEPGDAYDQPANGFCDFPPDFASVKKELPERRSAHVFVWSSPCGRAILQGGKTDCGAVDDTWQYDGASWQKRTDASEGEVCLRWRPDPTVCANLCN